MQKMKECMKKVSDVNFDKFELYCLRNILYIQEEHENAVISVLASAPATAVAPAQDHDMTISQKPESFPSLDWEIDQKGEDESTLDLEIRELEAAVAKAKALHLVAKRQAFQREKIIHHGKENASKLDFANGIVVPAVLRKIFEDGKELQTTTTHGNEIYQDYLASKAGADARRAYERAREKALESSNASASLLERSNTHELRAFRDRISNALHDSTNLK